MAEPRMGFLDHLGELRSRLIVAVAAWGAAAIVAFFFVEPIFVWLKRPINDIKNIHLIYQTVLEPFMTKIKIAAFAGLGLALPVISYEFLAFVSPALRKKEKKYIYPILFFLVLLFVGGAMFCYFLVLKNSAEWLVNQSFGGMQPYLTVSQYISFVALFMIAFGVGFETPLVVLLLVMLGVVSPKALRQNWRVATVVILLVAAVATPDWSLPPMIILSVAMMVLYWISVLVSYALVRGRKKNLLEED